VTLPRETFESSPAGSSPAPPRLAASGKRVLRGVIGVIRAAKRRQRANRLCD
jgi:hypothetical protein